MENEEEENEKIYIKRERGVRRKAKRRKTECGRKTRKMKRWERERKEEG